jgi:DNA-binding transcriptional ArsR family regulator
MDFRHPFRLVTPTLDGDVLAVLARAEEGFSGRQLHRLLGRASEPGVRKAAERLVDQGIVLRNEVGKAKVYRLNRQHLAAAHVEGLAELRTSLISHLRTTLGGWEEPPLAGILFGSVARGEATPRSDLDLLLVRRRAVDEDSAVWQEQLSNLQRAATEWTGNDTRILEFGEEELAELAVAAVVEAAITEGVELFGSRRSLRNRLAREAR